MPEKRLIDVDIAEKSIRNAEAFARANIGCGYDEGGADALSSVADMLKTMPTVDAVEVVHGRWIPSKSIALSDKCSICHGWVTRHSVNERKTNYCPNCGAKMDGGK